MDRRQYILEGRTSVPGWFALTDAVLFDAVDAAQRDAGITGDILEIGCYQGASAILLGYMRRGAERVVVCDIFDGATHGPEDEDERHRFYQDLSRASFESNYLRFHDELPEVVAGPSAALAERGLAKTFRFIHIDGSHAYDAVRSDLLLSRGLLVEGGVVVFDDIVSRHTPGVTAAVWEGVLVGELVPLLQSKKLYGTWGEPIPIDVPSELPTYEHDVMGHVVRHVEDAPPADTAPPASVIDEADVGPPPVTHPVAPETDEAPPRLSALEHRMVEAKRHAVRAVRGGLDWMKRALHA
jgi:hypothetical protein